jgi:hypothetical protein
MVLDCHVNPKVLIINLIPWQSNYTGGGYEGSHAIVE